jgi:pyruvate,water dikinase
MPSPLGAAAAVPDSEPAALAPAASEPAEPATGGDGLAGPRAQARQIVGQPAGPGLAVGVARVVAGREDLAAFSDGEILVCDAIEPEMTFVVPLAAGIVERRGGMLIHGAIIAREYGLPCVTGVPRATELIRTGDRLTVDGYLGIVIVG